MKKIAVLAALCLSINAYAEEITGAFGYQFGDKIDISLGEVKKLEEGIEYIKLKTPPENFKQMNIAYTSDTQEIVSVIGFATYKEQECLDKAAAYQKAIEEKYQGKMLRRISMDDFSVELKQGDKFIGLSCNYDYKIKQSTLTLSYGDNARYFAAKERAAIQNAKQIDSSRL